MKPLHYLTPSLYVFTALLMFQAAPVALAKQTELTIIYSGNLDGELEPCGCSDEGDLGGIKRRTTVLDRQRKQNPQTVVISAGGLIASQGVNDDLKSRYIFKAFGRLNYDAIGVQWTDLSYGAEFAEKYDLPWVATNWVNNRFSRSKTITRTVNGRRIELRFFTWLDPDSSPVRQMPGGQPQVYDDIGKLAKSLAAANKQGALTVLTTTLPLAIIEDQMPLNNVDILFVRAGYEVYSKPEQKGHTLVLQPGSRGMRLGKLQLNLDDSNNIKSWHHDIISMPQSVPDAPRMKDWYADYNAEVKENYEKRVALKKQQQSGDSPFAGEEQCQQCHAKQYKVWQDSEHAKAFEDLEIVQKSFDPECIQCHTVGFNRPGGFIDISLTPNLMNVQCENCHGAARQHVKSGGQKPVANKDWTKARMCSQCHVQKHSPSFDLKQYWPKIAH